MRITPPGCITVEDIRRAKEILRELGELPPKRKYKRREAKEGRKHVKMN